MSFIAQVGPNFYIKSCHKDYGVCTTGDKSKAKEYPTREEAWLDCHSLVGNLWFRDDAFAVIEKTVDIKLSLEEADYILRNLNGRSDNVYLNSIIRKVSEAKKS